MADEEQRGRGIVVDLDALQAQAEGLYLHRFVEYVRKTRGEYGQFLILRAGDETAIRAAGDGSAERLDAVAVAAGVTDLDPATNPAGRLGD
jgi:hypothetical protein